MTRGILLALVAGFCAMSDLAASCPSHAFQYDNAEYADARRRLARRLELRGISNPAVLRSIATVPRHLFVPRSLAGRAYADEALPIEGGQTISQPYVVGLMTELSGAKRGAKVLEVGTGSGYQAAVLAEIGARVYSVEISRELAEAARLRLARLGYHGIHVKVGDGFNGWREYSPFDAIIVTAAAPRIPEPLIRQLADGGVVVVPLTGEGGRQTLVQGINRRGKLRTRRVTGVSFVPMQGQVEREKASAGERGTDKPGPPPLSSRAPRGQVAPAAGRRGEVGQRNR